jgi:hypothetical protein
LKDQNDLLLDDSISELILVKEKLKRLPHFSSIVSDNMIYEVETAYLKELEDPAAHFYVTYFVVSRCDIDELIIFDKILGVLLITKPKDYEHLANRLKSFEKREATGAYFELYVLSMLYKAFNNIVFYPTLCSGKKPDCNIVINQKEIFIEATILGQLVKDDTLLNQDIREGGGIHSRDPYHDKKRVENKICGEIDQFEYSKRNLIFLCFIDAFPRNPSVDWAIQSLENNGILNKISHIFIFKYNGTGFSLNSIRGGKAIPDYALTQEEIEMISKIFILSEGQN